MSELSFNLLVAGISILVGAAISSIIASLRKSATATEEQPEPISNPIPKTSQYPHDAIHLWQDQQRQEVVIKIGQRFLSAGDKLTPKEQKYIRTIALYIQRWLDDSESNESDKQLIRSDSEPEIQSAAIFDQAEISENELFQSASIVEQINYILQQKIAASSQKNISVMLMEKPNQGIVVMLGTDQYPDVNSIPDPEIKKFIKDAVSDWESQA